LFIADLHTHSHYSIATSKECDPEHLWQWARVKGVNLIGTGDFTHPAWREELRTKLEPDEEGFFRLREDSIPATTVKIPAYPVRFVLSGEISCIYKKNGRTRKVHNLVVLPDFKSADLISQRLDAIGNIRSDGRPILGLDSKHLLELVLECCPEAIFIPAHIWTPHFAVLGAKSGFDSVEECYEDLTDEILALETGLSSDPQMNWQLSALDRFALVSNSDAHSPSKLAREANLFSGEFSYSGMRRSLKRQDAGFEGTIEFFPEEGKYHLDGHRNCGLRWLPQQTKEADGVCPVCGRAVTVGVLNRIESFADRPFGVAPEGSRPFVRLVSLTTILAELMGRGKKSNKLYWALIEGLGSELHILQEASFDSIAAIAGNKVSEGVRMVREGKVSISPGFDGEYGRVTVF
jgi:uncharacterized protein (TIGR00375 family)